MSPGGPQTELCRPVLTRVTRVMASLSIFAAVLSGCSREYYRRDADCEVYRALEEKTPSSMPAVTITPSPESRLFDPFDPDHPPMPPDDPAAHESMHCVYGMKGAKQWHEHGDAPSVEQASWLQYLSLSADGKVMLSPQRAVELGLLHSREYQTELEDLYLSALALTLERFEFDVQWFAGNETVFEHFGSSSEDEKGTPAVEGNETNSLTTETQVGFSRAFASGGQLIVNFANTFVWQFTGSGDHSASSNIAIHLVQPLLRRAGREVRLASLTQAERRVLYAARDFARFRKQFFVDITTGENGYLALLLQLQGIRNFDANLASLEQSLRLHEALAAAGIVSRIQVDQVFQSYQRARFNLIQAQAEHESALDDYKLLLGLPPALPVQLDDSLLQPFELVDPVVNQLERQVEEVLGRLRTHDEAPPLDDLRSAAAALVPIQQQFQHLLATLGPEMARWKTTIDRASDSASPQTLRTSAVYEQLAERAAQLQSDLSTLDSELHQSSKLLEDGQSIAAWEALQKLAGHQAKHVAEFFVIQTQVRAHLIELLPISYETETAKQFALANRLDLMNERARVVDAWRGITVAADALESDLDVFLNVDIGTDPDHANPANFSSEASRFDVGFRIDGPLNRKAERNNYRLSLVHYQRSRRRYMELEDRIVRAVRQDVRQLEADRLNFEITRERLITAARQVELARAQLVAPGPAGDSSSTQDVLNALGDLLEAKNALIRTWVRYETGRIQLLLDIEALQLDARGVRNDEYESNTRHSGLAPAPSRHAEPAFQLFELVH